MRPPFTLNIDIKNKFYIITDADGINTHPDKKRIEFNSLFLEAYTEPEPPRALIVIDNGGQWNVYHLDTGTGAINDGGYIINIIDSDDNQLKIIH